MIFSGPLAAAIECSGCGLDFAMYPSFALSGGGDDPLYALCPQFGCGARTRVARVGDVLHPWKLPTEAG